MSDNEKTGTSTQGSIESHHSAQQHLQYSVSASASVVTGPNRWNWVDHVKRAYILLLGLAAIGFSVIVVYSCEFFTYRSLDGQPWEGLMPPFDSLASASVGLFSFSGTVSEETIDLSFLDGQCIEYDKPWTTGQSDYWFIAQWCTIAAPAAGFLAWIQLVLETVWCRLRCSFLLITLLFLAASALQGCSFLIFADREFCFNAASQNQCRLDSGAWFSMASTVSYLILAILCTSIDPYIGHNAKLFCFIMTGRCCCCQREKELSSRDDIESQGEDKLNKDASESSTDGQKWHEVVEDEDEDKDFGDSNVAAVDSSFSGLNWKPTDDTKDEEDATQTSSMLQSPDTGLALNSASLESDNHPNLTQSESDVPLNKNDTYVEERKTAIMPYQHSFPRKPDFLDMCCAGDPLQVEKHLEQPVELQKSKAGGDW